MKTISSEMQVSGSQCVRSGCVVAGGGDGGGVPGEETCCCAAPGPCSADEMGYGLVALWLAGLVFFLGVAALWNGLGFEGYGLLVVAVLGLLRASKHVAEAQRLAKEEDLRREAEWKAWAEKVASAE